MRNILFVLEIPVYCSYSGLFIFTVLWLPWETGPRKYYTIITKTVCLYPLLEVPGFLSCAQAFNRIEFIFVYGVSKCSNLIILHVTDFPSATCFKRLFSHIVHSCPLMVIN